MPNVYPTISVVIPTKDRPELLERCLKSIASQKPKPDEVIVIDSSVSDETKQLIIRIKKILSITYVSLKKLGFPIAYNTGVIKSQGSHIAFTSDDCLVGKDWIKNIKMQITKNPDIVIQGRVINIPKNNIYARIMGMHYKNWVKSHLGSDGLFDCIDSKAAIVPKSFFYDKGKFSGFDKRLRYGSEDIEFGQRLVAHGFKIKYCPKIYIYHKERTTLNSFVRQHVRIAKAEGMLTRVTEYGNVKLFPKSKTLRNIKSFIELETIAFKKGNLINSIKIPFLYLLLFFIRIYGYSIWPKISKSA